MNIKSNYWRAALLCLPLVSGMVILELPQTNFSGWITTSAIANLLMIFGLCVTVCYQTFLFLRFEILSPKKSTIFKINALIPAVFYISYLLLNIYSTGIKIGNYKSESLNGPVPISKYGWQGQVTLVLMLHSLVTFLFINNSYVSSVIKGIKQIEEQEKQRRDFLVPMRILVRTTVWAYVGAMILIVIVDITKLNIIS